MITLIAFALALQDGSPFSAPDTYKAKITFENGAVLWIKGGKYRFDGGPKGTVVHDGEWTLSTNERGKTCTREPSLLTALAKLWKEADDTQKAAARKNLENYVFNPIVREWHKIDGAGFKKSDGGKVLDKETELIEATRGPALKLWRIKGTQVILQFNLFGTMYAAKAIDERADVPDDTFKAPSGYKEEKSDTAGDAERLWRELSR